MMEFGENSMAMD